MRNRAGTIAICTLALIGAIHIVVFAEQALKEHYTVTCVSTDDDEDMTHHSVPTKQPTRLDTIRL